MKRILTIMLACFMIAALSIASWAYWEAEEAFLEVKFTIGKQTTAWNPDGVITDGEYYKVDIDPTWISYAINDNDTDAGLAYAKSVTPELYMSWDETGIYTATVYTVPNGHENLWDGDPASMWYSGAVQFNYANFDEVASEYRLEYGVGLSSDTGDTLYTVWADGAATGFTPSEENARVWLNDNTLTYETKVLWEDFADEDNTAGKEGLGFNFCLVWSIGEGQDYVHIQLAEGCTGNGKHAENFAQVTLGPAQASAGSSSSDGIDAFDEIWVTAEQEFYDDPETLYEGGSGQPIQYVEGYGVGYSSLNDQVIFRDIDFGENGAEKMLINFSNGGADDTTLAIYIDEKAGDPDATYTIPNTGGWEAVWAEDFETPINVKGGKHDVIIEFTNSNSGSFYYIKFFEKAAGAAAAPAYPASGESGDIIAGTVIGNETGWGDNANAGRAAAFDGNPETFFDPLGVGDGYCGMDAGEPYILDKVAILSRGFDADWNARFKGAEIRGGNEDDPATAVTLWKSDTVGTYPDYYIITEFENNTGYRYFFYYNTEEHGDVAEVEFYGHPGTAAAGYADVTAAADGKNVITAYEFVEGTNGFGSELPANLFDGDTATKFCTNEFPATGIAKLDGLYTITGFTMATANDNAEYNGRSPNAWTISVSGDGLTWTELAKGDDSFFEETNFTYYVGEASAEGVGYVKFTADSTASGTFQVSELTLFGDRTGDLVVRENYAKGAAVTVSSTETADFPGELAVDGDMATRWASAYTDDEYITIDLGSAKAVNYVALYWETAKAADYEIYGSLTEGNLEEKTLATVTGNADANNILEFETTAVRYLTIHSSKRATEWGNSLYEIVVSGEGDANVDAELEVKSSPNTFDIGIIAAVASVISLAGFAVAKKH